MISLQNLRNAKISLCSVGCFRQRRLLTQRRTHFIVACGVGLLTLSCESAQSGLDVCGVEFTELLNITDYFGHLWAKDLEFLLRKLKVRKLCNFLDVGFFDRHTIAKSVSVIFFLTPQRRGRRSQK